MSVVSVTNMRYVHLHCHYQHLTVRRVQAGAGEEEVRGQGRDRLPGQFGVLRGPRLEP